MIGTLILWQYLFFRIRITRIQYDFKFFLFVFYKRCLTAVYKAFFRKIRIHEQEIASSIISVHKTKLFYIYSVLFLIPSNYKKVIRIFVF